MSASKVLGECGAGMAQQPPQRKTDDGDRGGGGGGGGGGGDGDGDDEMEDV